MPSYSLKSMIVKGGDDLRQELLVMQLIRMFQKQFQEFNVPIKLFPYEIIVYSHNSGFLEFLENTQSIDQLKKHSKMSSLFEIFKKEFSDNLEQAQKNFAESLAGYSIVQYLLQVKDRHNGNILINHTGHIVHIDFGFIFNQSPGNLNFETAPFKFTKEYLQILGGFSSKFFEYF